MDKLALDEVFHEIHTQVATRVAEGFDDDEGIVGGVTESVEADHELEDDEADDLRLHVERITAAELERHRRLQSSWVGPTDCDRLDQAFAELEGHGIVARQNFTCCQTCGHAEIWDEIAAASGERPVEGYTFYHMQDTESACWGGHLYLAYGATAEEPEALVNVARRIVRALERAGLTAEWDGNTSRRIGVRLTWRRRRP
jgi:hypothetical protein